MPVKMRLQRKGRRKAPYYHIVVADARSPRDGKFIERLGFYNPMTKPATIEIDRDAAYDWLTKGAQPTETVAAILKFKGVLYKKHLMRGVKKGALTLEQAETKYQEWISSKDSKVAARFEQTKQEKEAQRVAIFGKAKPAPVAEPTPVEEEIVENTATAIENAADVVEEVVEQVSEATEAVVEQAVEVAEEAVETVAEKVEEVVEAASDAVATTEETTTEETPAEEASEEASEEAKEEEK